MKNVAAVRLLLLANFISGIAQGISMISIPVYFAEQQASNWFNIVYGVVTVVSLFWSPYGGTLIDRYNRKTIFLILNIFNGLAIGTIAYMEHHGLGHTNYLAAAVFALTFLNFNLHYPCFYAFMQEISEKEHYNRIASYIEVQSQLASAIAGAAAAFLLGGGIELTSLGIHIPAWDLADVFTLDACTYFVAFSIIFIIKYIPVAERKEEVGSAWSRLRTGYNYLKTRPYIFLFGVVTYAVFIVVLLHVFNLAPLYVEQHLQVPNAQQIFAISEVFYAAGAITAGLAIQKIFGGMAYVKAIVILMAITVGEFILMISTQWVLLFYIMSLLLGITNAGIRVIRVSYLFNVLPNQVIGRAGSIFFVTNALARVFFLALFSLPFFHHSGHVIYAFMILTGFMLVCMMILIYFYNQLSLNQS